MGRRWWVFGLLFALAVTFLSPLASGAPDGFERVAEDKGYLDRAADAPYHVIADYAFPWVQNEALSTILAGLVGTLLVFGVVMGLAHLLRRVTTRQASR